MVGWGWWWLWIKVVVRFWLGIQGGGGLSSHITSSCFAKCVAFENWMMRKTLKRENTGAGFVKSPNSPL